MLTYRERKSGERRKWQAAPAGFHYKAERDSWNVSERSHRMKKRGSCRENLQLWPPFLTLVPFLWMISLCVVQCSHLQYEFHMSAENATSSPKIPQLSIYCYHLTSLFHGLMIIHTSSSLHLNLKVFFGRFTHFYFHIYSLLTFGSISVLFSVCNSVMLCPGKGRAYTRLHHHKIVAY